MTWNDRFEIEFPSSATTKEKILLLNSVVYLNQFFFELIWSNNHSIIYELLLSSFCVLSQINSPFLWKKMLKGLADSGSSFIFFNYLSMQESLTKTLHFFEQIGHWFYIRCVITFLMNSSRSNTLEWWQSIPLPGFYINLSSSNIYIFNWSLF